MCTFCPKDTKFTTSGKLLNHVRRLHADFNQKERGGKRKGRKDEEEEVFPKKAKWSWDGNYNTLIKYSEKKL